jgi:hypothetical protein
MQGIFELCGNSSSNAINAQPTCIRGTILIRKVIFG